MKRMLILAVMLVALIFVACDLFGKKEDYFPTNVGSKWEYEGYVIQQGGTDAPVDTVANLKVTIVAEKKDKLNSGLDGVMMINSMEINYLPPYETIYTAVDTNYVVETNDAVLSYDSKDDTVPDTTLVLPLKEGKTWQVYEGVVAKVLLQEDVTVKAGTYRKAWKVEQTEPATSYKEYLWYANNVGIVKGYSETTWGSTVTKFVLELVKATIK